MLHDDVSYGHWLSTVCTETSITNDYGNYGASTRKHKEDEERMEPEQGA